MTDVVLYIATSLDGFIATPEGGIDWLSQIETPEEDYGYGAFYAEVDALVMGRRTVDGTSLGPCLTKVCRGD